MNLKVEKFFLDSGCKILAMARLSQCEYGIFLYLLNCAISGFDQFLTTSDELSSVISWDNKAIDTALAGLSAKNMIRLHFNAASSKKEKKSFRISIQYKISKWQLPFEHDASTEDAIVFPFRRKGAKNLKLFEGQVKAQKIERKSKKVGVKPATVTTWDRVLESYLISRSLDDDELVEAEVYAKMLVETYPVDQILLLLRHFGQRIPTLSLLASSWQHYMELFEEETQKVDLLGARKKHIELDTKLRESAETLLSRSKELGFSEDEAMVLQILSKHRFPRRQLFWAYQLRSRYPKLIEFFAKHVSMMLPVTSRGLVVKRPEE